MKIEPVQSGVTREWIESEIATIERHLQGQPSQTLAALKLALERMDQIAGEKPKGIAAQEIAAMISHTSMPIGLIPTPPTAGGKRHE